MCSDEEREKIIEKNIYELLNYEAIIYEFLLN